MSYFFSIIGTNDNPVFEHEFGTSRHGGDGLARFPDERRYMNQFTVHAGLDAVDEEVWRSGNMYLKYIDVVGTSHVYAFVTGSKVRFMLLYDPETHPRTASGGGGAVGTIPGGPSGLGTSTTLSQSSTSTTTPSAGTATNAGTTAGSGSGRSGVVFNPTATATEDAIKNFFMDVYDAWLKTVMNPFYSINMPIRSPVFRTRVAGAAKRLL